MKKKDLFLIALLLVCALGLLLFLELAQFPQRTFLWRAIFNAGHAPLFGVLSLIMLALSRLISGLRIAKEHFHYLLAFMTAVIIGAVSEYIQVFGERDADPLDLLRNVIGAASFLAIYASYDSGLAAATDKMTHKMRISFRLFGIVLLLAVFMPVFLWSAAYLHRSSNLPQICGFESGWEMMFLETESAELELTAPPEGWPGDAGDRVAKLTFGIDEYADFIISEPYPDWSRYKNLIFEVYSELDSIISLNIRIEDAQHDQTYADRFNRQIAVQPGYNRIIISLAEVRDAPASREMNMKAVRSFSLFAYRPSNSFTVYLDNFSLR